MICVIRGHFNKRVFTIIIEYSRLTLTLLFAERKNNQMIAKNPLYVDYSDNPADYNHCSVCS